jgi:hypothetical protein
MDDREIEAVLERAERALAEGRDLRGTGFWGVVGALRADRTLAVGYADRVGAIDRAVFERGVRARVPLALGLLALVVVTAIGVLGVALSWRAGVHPIGAWFNYDPYGTPALYQRPGFVPIAFLIGFGALILGTHSLTHWIVGRLVGIRFTHVFLGGPPPPRPGVKTDYASYLRASPRARAVMHASGAVVTKIVPFALLSVSLPLYSGWPWLTWILLAVGVVQIVTDVTLSTKVSDWKKARREWRAAKS